MSPSSCTFVEPPAEPERSGETSVGTGLVILSTATRKPATDGKLVVRTDLFFCGHGRLGAWECRITVAQNYSVPGRHPQAPKRPCPIWVLGADQRVPTAEDGNGYPRADI